VTEPCTVLIAAPDLLPALKQRTGNVNGELLAFSDADALRALEVITKRRPRIVAIEKLFAATPRGAALINRIKADPSLVQSEIRVVSSDSEYTRVSPRTPTEAAPAQTPAPGATAAPAAAPVPAPPLDQRGTRRAPRVKIAAKVDAIVDGNAAAPAAAPVPAPPLDQRGTRRAPRVKIAAKVDAIVDGNAAALLDLSTVGAQVVAGSGLKPNQRVRVALSDEAGVVRFNATVAWVKFEIVPGGGPRYRAGLDFVDADAAAIDAFCGRHKAG